MVLGYHRQQSHALIGIEECPVLAPEIVAKLGALRAIAVALEGRKGAPVRVGVLVGPAGLDVAAQVEGPGPDAGRVAGLAQLARGNGIARITCNEEVIFVAAPPTLALAGVTLTPPPGLFVQAVAEAEATLVREVSSALAGVRRVTDLFAGLGTFTFALAHHARVLAVDAEGKALAALVSAVRRAPGLKPVDTLLRDLAHAPLSARELAPFDGVVLDPPRAGAQAQMEELGRSRVARVAYVSCNPATLARDMRVLVDAGFRVGRVVPVDQFLFSAQLEAVAVLYR